MSGRSARAGRLDRRKAGLALGNAAGFRSGMAGPGPYRLRLARREDASAVQQLLPLAQVEPEPELIAELFAGRLTGELTLRAAFDAHTGAVQALAEESIGGGVGQALRASFVVLVAIPPNATEAVGAVVISPPGNVMMQLQNQGVHDNELLLPLLSIRKISAVAVHPDHRRRGLGKALLAQATGLAHRAKATHVYGQTRTSDGLTGWYKRLGYRVQLAGQGLDMSWLLQRPFMIVPGPGEQIFVSTKQAPAGAR